MSLKNVKSSLQKINKTLAKSHASREYLIKNSRQIVNLCSQSIIEVHKGDLKSAKVKTKRASKLLSQYRRKASKDQLRYLTIAEQEFTEAYAFISIVEKKDIPSATTLKVGSEPYILGLLDCIGELKRILYDKIRVGDSNEASRIFNIMQSLYLHLYPFANYDKIVKEVRRKLDVNRILVEDARSALTEEIRRNKLIDAVTKKRK